MPSKKSAERALKEIISYRDALDVRTNRDLILALDRVVDVVQNHLYHAYLDVRYFYETTLLSPEIPQKLKTDMALDIAGRWEQIDRSSSALSTSFTQSEERVTSGLAGGPRSHSMSHITKQSTQGYDSRKRSLSKDRLTDITSSFGQLDLVKRHHCDRKYRHHQGRLNNHIEESEPLFDDNTEASSQSPSFGSVSVSKSSSPSHHQRQDHNRESWFSSTFRVQLTRGPQGFGFSIAGGTDQEPSMPSIDPRYVYVARITPGGVADIDGRLRVNDILLSVNGCGLVGLPHLKAVTVFEQSGSCLDMEVQRPPFSSNQEMLRPPFSQASPQISATAGRHGPSAVDAHPHQTTPTNPVRTRLNALSRSHCIMLPVPSSNSSSVASASCNESGGAPPITVSPISSTFTSCPNSNSASSADVFRATKKVSRFTKKRKGMEEKKAENYVDGTEEDTVWLYDPEQTFSSKTKTLENDANEVNSRESVADSRSSSLISGVDGTPISQIPKETPGERAMQSIKSSLSPPVVSSTTTIDTHRWDLSARPQPDPQPGPVILEVLLVRGTGDGLGFSIAGGVGTEFLEDDSGIFITQVTPGGVADTCGRIGVGDRLVRVNSVSLVDVTHAQAVEILQNAGDFVLLLLVKASVQSSPKRINCRQCQETIRGLHSSSNACTRNDGKTSDRHAPHASLDKFPATRSHSSRRGSGSRSRLTKQPRSLVVGPPKRTAETVPLSSSSHGSEDYAAAHAVPDSILQRWPRARLVTLYKESPRTPMTDNHGAPSGGSLGFNIIGGVGADGIYISHIHPNRPAANSKAISVGDRLLVVNGVEVVGSSHEEAAILLKTSPSRVDLVLTYAPGEFGKLEEQIRAQEEEAQSDDELARDGSTDVEGGPARPPLPIEADGLFVRVLADFDPHEVMEPNQVIPRSAISIRSGDILQLINVSDREWWQARIIHPSTCKPKGLAGLVPSRRRLERQESAKWHLRFGCGPSADICRLSATSQPSSSDSSPATDPQSTDKAIESLPLSLSEATSPSANRPEEQRGSVVAPRKKTKNKNGRRGSSGRTPSVPASGFTPPPTYIPVTSVQAVGTRPVVILGDLKHNISDDLLAEFPDSFATCVPHTTRPRRRGEVEGQDYHFVKSRSRMESEIQLNRYIEAGEYNGNLYGTHLQSVFKVAKAGQHCLLDVGVSALRRLAIAGLHPITIFLISDLPDQALRVVDPSGSKLKQEEAVNPYRRPKRRQKNFAFLRENSPLLTALLIVEDYEKILERIQITIEENAGPNVWVSSENSLPLSSF